MRRAAWVHLLAAYLSVAASATFDSPMSDRPSAPVDPLSNVQRAWASPSTNERAEQPQDEEKPHPRRFFPRRTASRRRRRIHP